MKAGRRNQAQEGKAQFFVGEAFFRASSRTGRDLAVLAAIAYKRKHGSLRILDAMTGCGVRPLRYVLEAEADYVWANEGNVDLRSLLGANLSCGLTCDRYHITHMDANAAFFDCYQRQDFYDLIDIDSFGGPMPYLSTALWAVKLGGLLYLTSTDGRATSGHAPEKSVQTYGATARSHPAIHEQGLRLLIGAVAQQAAAKGLAAYPVFSFYQGEVNRVMVRVTRRSAETAGPKAGPKAADRSGSQFESHYGFLAYCHHCGHFQTVLWKKLGRVVCPCAAADAPVVSGPMWLGPLHDSETLTNMQHIMIEHHAQQPSDSGVHCQELLAMMQAEATMPPYHYTLAEIGRRGKMDIPPRQSLIEKLQQQGFQATRTHLSAQAIKTNAPIARCIQLAQQLS
ncbi:MAG: tRNA (guanine-N1)-methyltransferase [Phormidesmis sp. RL_2_1]|nr:tRNA (guanine-N1)-methyltransferase [Phormidesmis sp. RL_2_1]